MALILKNEYKLKSEESEQRLEELCSDVANIVGCTAYFGLLGIREVLDEILLTSQSKEVIFQIELMEHMKQKGIATEPYLQLLFNIELLYIKLYMINETITKNKNLPPLNISNLKFFRLIFAHDTTDVVFKGRKPFVYFINWIKPDLSELCYRFFDFQGNNQVEEVMQISKDITTFQDWYKEVSSK